jgi:hypothetical protein
MRSKSKCRVMSVALLSTVASRLDCRLAIGYHTFKCVGIFPVVCLYLHLIKVIIWELSAAHAIDLIDRFRGGFDTRETNSELVSEMSRLDLSRHIAWAQWNWLCWRWKTYRKF